MSVERGARSASRLATPLAILVMMSIGTPEVRSQEPSKSGALKVSGQAQPANPAALPPAGLPIGAELAADYVIGPDDVLSVVFWREKELSGEVTVRPDGRISLPLLNDIHAAGLTPDQLRDHVLQRAASLVEDPQATIVVKTVNSRKVFITGMVERPGSYPLTNRTTVLQLIATAGGLREFAKADDTVVIRNQNGRETRFRFDYKQVIKGKRLEQNVELKPGDTVVVP
jgi:polysaccharide export outer membrane protein